MLTARGTLTKQPLGWNNVEGFLKVCYGSWGQKGCFSVNSMREFADLPPKARQIMIANMTKAHQLLIDNLAAARGGTDDNESLADLIITSFCGICLDPDRPGGEARCVRDWGIVTQVTTPATSRRSSHPGPVDTASSW
jgi:hypothetical protein